MAISGRDLVEFGRFVSGQYRFLKCADFEAYPSPWTNAVDFPVKSYRQILWSRLEKRSCYLRYPRSIIRERSRPKPRLQTKSCPVFDSYFVSLALESHDIPILTDNIGIFLSPAKKNEWHVVHECFFLEPQISNSLHICRKHSSVAPAKRNDRRIRSVEL